MTKNYAIFVFLCTFYIVASTNKTDVFYDPKYDIIFHNGKLYFPNKNSNTNFGEKNNDVNKNGNSNQYPNQNTHANTNSNHEEELVSGAAFWVYIMIILFLTIFAGLMSGLTVGYLSIDDLVLELRHNNGTDEEKQHADKVLPILAQRHWLLVTLLLMNAFCMEALPLFLDKIVPEFLAIIISVSLVLLFGEIIPQAICTGPEQVRIAAMVAPLTKGLMWVTYPISYPIARLLDYLLGEHHKSRFMNNDLKSLIELHTFNALEKMHINPNDEKDNQQSGKMGLNDEQAHLMISALEIKEKKVLSFMIPIKNVFMIDYDDILDKYKLSHILDKGYSRIPVYSNHNKNDIVGLLRIKQLIGVDFNQNKSLRQLGIELRKPIVVSPNVSIIDLLREFRKGKSHMAFITEQVEDLQNKFGLNRSNSIKKDFTKELLYGKELEMHNIFVLGIITLEDIIEKMINLDILDEDDYEKVTRNTRKKAMKIDSNQKISKEIANSFIKEESMKLESIIKESMGRRKSIKEMFLNKNNNPYDSEQNSLSNKFLKDHYV